RTSRLLQMKEEAAILLDVSQNTSRDCMDEPMIDDKDEALQPVGSPPSSPAATHSHSEPTNTSFSNSRDSAEEFESTAEETTERIELTEGEFKKDDSQLDTAFYILNRERGECLSRTFLFFGYVEFADLQIGNRIHYIDVPEMVYHGV